METTKDSVTHLRSLLKNSLIMRRGRLTAQGYMPVCPVCNKIITDAPDLHEVFIDRQDIVGINDDSEKLLSISVEENCVNIHSGGKGNSCHGKAHTEKGKIACMQYLLVWEGHTNILNFIKSMGEKYPNLIRAGVISETIRLLDLADDRLQE